MWHSPRRRDQRSRGMSDKLAQSLEDIIASNPGKGKGKGGRGGAIKKAGAGRGARAAAAPYQKPVKASKGVAALSLAELTQMKQPSAMKAEAPAFVLTTGTTIRVGNLDKNVSRCNLQLNSSKPCRAHHQCTLLFAVLILKSFSPPLGLSNPPRWLRSQMVDQRDSPPLYSNARRMQSRLSRSITTFRSMASH